MEKVIAFLIGLALVFGVMLLFTFPVMWLWNWLMPMIFGLMKLSFWQAFGLQFLCWCLFKGSSFGSDKD